MEASCAQNRPRPDTSYTQRRSTLIAQGGSGWFNGSHVAGQFTLRGHIMSQQDTNESREKLWELIKDTKFAMFTTRHSNGHLHSRPMTTQNKKVDEDSSLWFFMSRSGDPVEDIAA